MNLSDYQITPEFVRTLQSIAKVEENPRYRLKKYVIVQREDQAVESGSVPVVLKHPETIVVVASSNENVPSAVAGERRVEKLSDALKIARVKCLLGHRGCSIVINEGMYINHNDGLGSHGMMGLGWTKGFSLEIVGLEEVRILNTSTIHSVFSAEYIELTLKNLSIYGRQGASAATLFAFAATVTMVDVRTHGARGVVLELEHGTNFKAVNCASAEFLNNFYVKESKAIFEDCEWLYSEESGGRMAATLTNSDSTPINMRYGQIINGYATFDRCQFRSGITRSGFDPRLGEYVKMMAITLTTRGKATVTDCKISGFDAAFELEDSFTEAVVKRCKIIDCGLAFDAQTNSEVVVTECELVVEQVLRLTLNIKGKAKFKGNVVRQSTRLFPTLHQDHMKKRSSRGSIGKRTAVIYTDREPQILKHDFAKTCVRYFDSKDYKPYLAGQTYGTTRETRAGHRQWNSESKSESHRWGGDDWPDLPNSQLRECLHCLISPFEKPGAKFQYCSRCRKVSYCSKECQVANWRDHKYRCEA